MRKIALIGSTAYKDSIFAQLTEMLEAEGFEVRSPVFDSNPMFNSLEICEYNRALIEWADEVRLIWDQRSMGTIFDAGMAFAMRKPLKIEYLEPKTFREVFERWEKKSLDAQRRAESAADGSGLSLTSSPTSQPGCESGPKPEESGAKAGSSSRRVALS